jgi:hypothetical protein
MPRGILASKKPSRRTFLRFSTFGCVLATNVFTEVQGDLVLVAEPVEEAQEVQLDRSVQLEGTVFSSFILACAVA